jgi:Zn-dependent protease with chaperone function
MDFFGRQDRARRQTRWLIGVFALAVLLVSAAVSVVVTLLLQAMDGRWIAPDRAWLADSAGLLGVVALVTAGFILVASLLRHLRLRSGGGEVAVSLGGEPVLPEDRDPGRRRLTHVIEEMSLAAGIPAPQAYVLEHESSINAFAAGHSPADAAVAVTRGALDRLSRDELQGVVAHEFSHVLNGDMRLNIRLMGYLFGILAVSMVGRFMLRGGGHRGVRTGRSGGAAAVALAGVAIYLLGYAGVFCGRLIQAAVSRQREFLADAAAVQFTRQTEGLAGALRKIAGLPAHSWLSATRAEEVSHMLFAGGHRSLARLFATHPPIADRLAALGAPAEATAAGAAPAEGTSGFAPGRAGRAGAVATDAVVAAVGTEAPDAVARREGLRRRVPEAAWAAIHRSDLAVPALLGLLLDAVPAIRQRQLDVIRTRLGIAVAGQAERLGLHLADSAPADRLALADLAFPVLRLLPDLRREYLAETIERLAAADDELELFETMLTSRVVTALRAIGQPDAPQTAAVHERALAASRLLAALALHGHDTPTAAAAAFGEGLRRLAGRWPVTADTALPTRVPAGAELRRDLATLAALPPADARLLVDSLAAAAAEDGYVDEKEYTVLRAACGALGLPLPPLPTAVRSGRPGS